MDMRPWRKWAWAGCVAVLTVATHGCDAPGQGEPDPVMLPAATDTVMVPEPVVTGAAALGGAWLVTAPDDGVVRRVELGGSDQASEFGAADAFQHPQYVFTADGRAYVGDWGMRRVTVWSADGTLMDTIPALAMAAGALPRAVDAAGRLYAEVYPLPSAEVDSGLVLRISADGQRVDTVAQLAPYDLAEVREERGVRMQRRALSGSDAWGVLADGTIWVARVDQNRVDWIGPEGDVTRGGGLPDRVLQVTEADRELFVQQYPPELRAEAERLPFAIVKPPFTAAFTGADGRVWLEKSRAIGDSARRYHVVQRDGGFVGELQLAGLGRILAADADAALVALPVPDSGTRLLRVPLPPVSAPAVD